jgi:SnoaL-like domain
MKRRHFIRNAGAALASAAAAAGTASRGIAAGAGPANAGADTATAGVASDAVAAAARASNIAATVGASNVAADIDAIRKLHYALGYCLDHRLHENLVGLLAEHADVCVDLRGVQGCLLNPAQESTVEIAPDGRSAKARFRCLMQVGNPLGEALPMLEMEMARQQGQSIVLGWQEGAFEIHCVREAEAWKISRLSWRA